jgi:hypothetical protein
MSEPADVLRDFLTKRQQEMVERREAYEREQASDAYQHELRRLARICTDFLRTLTSCWICATRIPDFVNKSMLMRSTDDFIESSVCVRRSVEEGARNPARRELRYLIELAIKTLFVDQSMPQSSFEHRLIFFDRKVNADGITPEVNQLRLSLVPEAERQNIVSDLIAAYARACQYVHPSIKQIEERVELAEQGVTIGYDSAAELKAFNDEVFEVFALVLVLIFHGLGPSTCGDMFEGLFNHWQNWGFHAHRHVIRIDKGYDYKAERQGRLEELNQQRAERLANRPTVG